jgi:hypothetical protein
LHLGGWVSRDGDYVWEDDGVVLDAVKEANQFSDLAFEKAAPLVPPKLQSGVFRPKQR